MRRSLLILPALAFLFAAGAIEQPALKMGYVDSEEILRSSADAAAAEQAWEEEMQGYQAEIRQLEEELTGMQERLQQQQLTLSPEARANREQQIQARLQEYQQRTSQLSQIAEQRQAELIQPVVDQVNAVIETLREEGQYSMILDVAAGAIIAADPTLDLTAEVILRLENAQQ